MVLEGLALQLVRFLCNGFYVLVWIGEGNLMVVFLFMSLYCFIAKTAVTGRPKRGESQKASREEAHSLETACSGAGGIGSSGGKFFCVAVFMCLCGLERET